MILRLIREKNLLFSRISLIRFYICTGIKVTLGANSKLIVIYVHSNEAPGNIGFPQPEAFL